MNIKAVAVLATVILASSSLFAAPWTFDKSHSRIGFSVDHMGYSTTFGQFKKFDGTVDYDPKKPSQTKVNVQIQTNSIDSAWPARDAHLVNEDFFNVKKYPTMTFQSTKVVLNGSDKGRLYGNLTMLGVSKPVAFDVQLNKHAVSQLSKKDTIGFKAKTTIKRSDWGMKSYLPAVGDEVKIMIDAELNPR